MIGTKRGTEDTRRTFKLINRKLHGNAIEEDEQQKQYYSKPNIGNLILQQHMTHSL